MSSESDEHVLSFSAYQIMCQKIERVMLMENESGFIEMLYIFEPAYLQGISLNQFAFSNQHYSIAQCTFCCNIISFRVRSE